ncbi:hypothetical protein AMEX_G20750 [Astyanax mexicanus]|uniref:Uncharacterized protein n=1 Tax=Astyanax mexicanus TaxID=7994 RepID=A0A8T2L2S7_ASTMX|nr:hypothetical protein AMEX_G20750 [Astyanax mexicanus]
MRQEVVKPCVLRRTSTVKSVQDHHTHCRGWCEPDLKQSTPCLPTHFSRAGAAGHKPCFQLSCSERPGERTPRRPLTIQRVKRHQTTAPDIVVGHGLGRRLSCKLWTVEEKVERVELQKALSQRRERPVGSNQGVTRED